MFDVYLVIPAQICDELSHEQANFLEFWVKIDNQGRWPPFSVPAERIPCLAHIWWFQLKSVTSYRADKLNFTDRHSQRQYPFSLKRPRGKNVNREKLRVEETGSELHPLNIESQEYVVLYYLHLFTLKLLCTNPQFTRFSSTESLAHTTARNHFTNGIWAHNPNRIKHVSLLRKKLSSNQVAILHMSRQLSCRDVQKCNLIRSLELEPK